MQKITWSEISCEVSELCQRLELVCSNQSPDKLLLWPIPRGGLFIAGFMVEKFPHRFRIAVSMHEATLLVDDIICSGKTACVLSKLLNTPVVAPYWRSGAKYVPIIKSRVLTTKDYLVFPWECISTELTKEIQERGLV